VGLEESPVVRTSVPLGDGTGRYRLGSGYLVADGLVLTAAHILAVGEGAVASTGTMAEVAGPDGTWRQASVAWADAARDVAVLACPALRAAGRVRWGRLAGPDPLDWGSVGFPAASTARDGGRQAEHAFGRTSPISERTAGTLALTIESRDPTRQQGGSPWAGLSGAAVFWGEHLAGVITADTGSYDKSLTAPRADDFCADPALAAVLGGLPVLEQVTGRPRKPGLADLRTTPRPRNTAFTGRTPMCSPWPSTRPGRSSPPVTARAARTYGAWPPARSPRRDGERLEVLLRGIDHGDLDLVGAGCRRGAADRQRRLSAAAVSPSGRLV